MELEGHSEGSNCSGKPPDSWLEGALSRLSVSDEVPDENDPMDFSEDLASIYSASEHKALEILTSKSACSACYTTLRKKCRMVHSEKVLTGNKVFANTLFHSKSNKFNDRASVSSSMMYPGSAMSTVCDAVVMHVSLKIGIKEQLKVAYESYLLEFGKSEEFQHESAKSEGTFMRVFLRHDNLFVVRSNIKSEGSIIMSQDTARSFMLSGANSKILIIHLLQMTPWKI